MTNTEKFFRAELIMRLAGRGGYQYCLWPCGDTFCYELLVPEETIYRVEHNARALPVCQIHYHDWLEIQWAADAAAHPEITLLGVS